MIINSKTDEKEDKMKKNIVVVIMTIVCVSVGALSLGAKNVKAEENNTELSSETETSSFSCVGSWANENENNIFTLVEDGTGSYTQIGTISDENGTVVGSRKETSSLTWEDKGDAISISFAYGTYDFDKSIEDEQEVLRTGKAKYTRKSDEEMNSITTNNNAQKDDLQEISFDLPLVYEDDILKVELVQFYENRVRWFGQNEPSTEKYIVFKVTNKNAAGFLFNLSSAYINSDEVNVIMNDGNRGPKTGKTKDFSYNIQYDTKPNATAISSIDELYDLDGVFEISVLDGDDYIINQYETDFSLQSLDLKAESGEEEIDETKSSNIAIKYDDSELIKLVQEKLNEAGYECGTPDGVYGQNTEKAISEFQAERELAETGLIDAELLETIGISIEEIPESAKTDSEG